MKILNTIFGIVVLTFSLFTAAEEGCKYDTQCKGERICVKGECVDQPAKSEGLESPGSSAPPSSTQLPAKPIESQSETKTEKSVFIGDWNVSITETERIKGKIDFSVYTEHDFKTVPKHDTEDWRITASNDSLIIETARTASRDWNTTIKDVKHKNHLLTFTEVIKGQRGKEIIQYYLKAVNEDKIEGQWKSQGNYQEKEWEVDGKLVMRRMFLPSPTPNPLPQIPENPGNDGTFLDKPEPPAMPPLRGPRSASPSFSSSSPRSNCSYCYTAWHNCNTVCRMALEPRPGCHDNCNINLASCEDKCRSSNW